MLNLPLKTLPQLHLLPGAISDLFAQVSLSGKITKADRYGLMAALLDEELKSDDRIAVDRLLYAVRRGKIHVANEISDVL